MKIESLVLYKKAQSLFEKYNPCDFKNGVCRSRREKPVNSSCLTFCTSCCRCGFECDKKNFKDGKCLIKSLACKLYFCYDFEVSEEFRNQLENLIKEAQKIYDGKLWAYLFRED
ncbi:MAG: hypothetical protein LBJ93_03175 [Clostridiales bacterium]|jgi:hypothetical protein|nr:hypothetical protein [Clostridiales bacterium]